MIRKKYRCHEDDESFCDAGACKLFDKCRLEDDGVCLLKERDEALAEDAADARREDKELGL